MADVSLNKEEIIKALKDIVSGAEGSSLVSEQHETFNLIANNLRVVIPNLEKIFSCSACRNKEQN